jgi:hypothetical protein
MNVLCKRWEISFEFIFSIDERLPIELKALPRLPCSVRNTREKALTD